MSENFAIAWKSGTDKEHAVLSKYCSDGILSISEKEKLTIAEKAVLEAQFSGINLSEKNDINLDTWLNKIDETSDIKINNVIQDESDDDVPDVDAAAETNLSRLISKPEDKHQKDETKNKIKKRTFFQELKMLTNIIATLTFGTIGAILIGCSMSKKALLTCGAVGSLIGGGFLCNELLKSKKKEPVKTEEISNPQNQNKTNFDTDSVSTIKSEALCL